MVFHVVRWVNPPIVSEDSINPSEEPKHRMTNGMHWEYQLHQEMAHWSLDYGLNRMNSILSEGTRLHELVVVLVYVVPQSMMV